MLNSTPRGGSQKHDGVGQKLKFQGQLRPLVSFVGLADDLRVIFKK